MKKKLIGAVLSLCLVSAFIPCIHAAEITNSGICGDNLTWTLDSEGTLTVSGSGEMNDSPWDEQKSNVKTVVIEEGITSILGYAFSECDNLTDITLCNSLTDIELGAFGNCKGLTEVILPEGLINIDSYAFSECENLKKINLPNSLKSIGDHAFVNNSLNYLYIPQNVNEIGHAAFAGNTGCTIEVSSDNQSFSSLDGVLFNKDKTKLIAYVGHPIQSGKRTVYTVPDGVEIIGKDAFCNIHNLSGIKLPESLIEFEEHALNAANFTDELVIPKNVSNIPGNAFRGSMESSYRVDENNKHFCSENGVIFSKDKSKLIAYPPCKDDKTYTIPSYVTVIGNSAFGNCDNLISVIIPDNVTNIQDDAFLYCNNLISAKIGNGTTTIGDGAFYGNYCLEDIYMGNSVTYIGYGAFDLCNKLKDLYYNGTKRQWNKIELNFPCLDSINIHYLVKEDLLKTNVTKKIDTNKNQVIFNITSLEEDRAEELDDISLFAAEYDENGLLTNLTMGTKSELSDNQININAPIPDSENYKFMLWDDLSRPVTEAITDIDN